MRIRNDLTSGPFELRINRLIVFIALLFSFMNCNSQELDSTNRAIEIYKKGKNKTYTIKIDQRVLITCMQIKHGYKKMVTAELLAIEGNKMHFEPLNKNYRETVCSLGSIEKIGVRTPFRVIESTVWFVNQLFHHNYFDFSNDLRSSFKVINLKSKKWGIRIVNL
jgi:hypothetical protein